MRKWTRLSYEDYCHKYKIKLRFRRMVEVFTYFQEQQKSNNVMKMSKGPEQIFLQRNWN